MGFLSDLRRANRATDFSMVLGKQGGSFETSCSPEQVLAGLKASGVEVVEETPTSLSVRPVSKDGNVRPELITAHVSAGRKLPTLVVITVKLNPNETNPMMANNPMTIPPLLGLLLKVGKIDPQWQPA